MTSPSKLGTAFLVAFGLPFLGAGLLLAIKLLRAPDQPIASRVGGAMFGSVFAVIGGGLIFGALYGYTRLKEQAKTASANPDSPWLWRKDWASRRIETQNKTKATGLWIAATLVNMLLLPVSLGAFSQLSRTEDPKYIVPAAIDLVGLILVLFAIRATIRFDRFGKTYFEMNALPYSPGGHISGAIHAQIPGDVPHGIDLTLTCLRRISTGSGNNQSTQEVPLWEDSKNIAAASVLRGPLDTVIPVDFAIPADAFQTDRNNMRDQVYWMLKAKADMPGVDYSDQFELPVYRTTLSPPVAASAAAMSGAPIGSFLRTTTTSGELAGEVSEPARHKVVVNDLPEGLEFRFRPARNALRTILVVGLAAAITGLFYAMLHMQRQPPKIVFALVGVMDFVLILAAIHAALSATQIVVGNGVISWRRTILGIGKSHEMQISDVDAVLAATSIQQASSSGSTSYSLRLKSKVGKSYTLVDDIESRQEVRWIVSQIEKRAGLAVNTQVEISNSFYGPPPQPGSASGSVFSPGGIRATTKSSSNWSQAVGAIVFLGWAGFMGYMMLRTTNIRRGGTRRAESSAAATAHTVRTEAMKRASVKEVTAFPAQQQAEGMLARAVAHDDEALQRLAENSAAWAGHIQRTDRLEQLENQARYSSDLRVRRAEANLELAADGCQKDATCADVLMDHARKNASDRALALYELGILAGDGVEAERAHQFVLDYARNNSDPVVRQWATEGLRFVGTDAALDELFEIFTHDPSFAVRDRAGCNISDCGIFQRKQRFRMAPRLIDLVSDPHLNPQMSGWCFMALREITGENLPADASAWRRWYNDNADAKRAQFDALDWWKVPGDD